MIHSIKFVICEKLRILFTEFAYRVFNCDTAKSIQPFELNAKPKLETAYYDLIHITYGWKWTIILLKIVSFILLRIIHFISIDIRFPTLCHYFGELCRLKALSMNCISKKFQLRDYDIYCKLHKLHKINERS